jgi:hypothetical protein
MSASAATVRPSDDRASRWDLTWPILAGALVGGATAYGATANDVAPVVAASGFVYLTAAALGRRGAAWPAFLVTFVLIGVAKVVDGFDPTLVMLGLAIVLAAVGLIEHRERPTWGLPLQAAAMVATGAVALWAADARPTLAAVLVAAGLFAHAAWDAHHLRTRRVVVASMARFCLVLDVVAGGLVLLALA